MAMLKPVLLAALLTTAAGARADETFVATLAPVAGTGSSGTGTAALVLSSDETQLSYNISFSGTLGPEIQAHIHIPDGSIVYALPVGSPKVGVWLNPGLLNVGLLRAEKLYILIHTSVVPQGELRGDITQAQTPIEPSTWGRVKALFED